MKKVSFYDHDVGLVSRCPGESAAFRCMSRTDRGEYKFATRAAEAARLAGYDKYALASEHVCEGPGCTVKTEYQYCAYCHFDNRRENDGPRIGILGM